ncbi:MAG: sulfotransferase, partial [Bacteroidota bacterium]
MYKPIFILGNPRSGTTLLRLLLTNHSEIVIAPESSFLVWWFDKYKDWKSSDQETSIEGFLDDLLTSKKIEHWQLDRAALKRRILKANPASYADLMQQVYLEYAFLKRTHISFWGDKNNYYVKCPEKVAAIYPNAVFIHIIRDVRDVICSYRDMNALKDVAYVPRLPQELKDMAQDWLDNNNNVLNFFESLSEGQSISVKYEDIVENTEKSISTICDLLDINFELSMLDYWKEENQKFFEPSTFRSWKKRNFQKIDNSKIGRFQSELSSAEITELNQMA